MAITLLNNAPATFAAREADKITDDISLTVKKLATGSVLADSSVDPANSAIANRAKAELAGLEQLLKNASSARTMLDTMEAYLKNISEMLIKASALGQQAASDNYSDSDRAMMDKEYQLLLEEIDRLSDTANYNGRLMFNTYKESSVSTIADPINSLIDIRSIQTKGDIDNMLYFEYDDVAQTATVGYFGGDSQTINVPQKSDLVELDFEDIGAKIQIYNTSAALAVQTAANAFSSGGTGSAAVSISNMSEDLNNAFATVPVVTVDAGSFDVTNATLSLPADDGLGDFEAVGVDLRAGTTSAKLLRVVEGNEQSITLDLNIGSSLNAGDTVTLNQLANTISSGPIVTEQDFTFRIGTGITGSNAENRLDVTVDTTSTKVFGIRETSLLTAADANDVIENLRLAIDKLAENTATVGAGKSQLDNVVAIIKTSLDNIAKAIDTVSAADFLAEMENMTKYETLMKSANAMFGKIKQVMSEAISDLLRKV